MHSASNANILIPYSTNYQSPLSLEEKTSLLQCGLHTCYSSMLKEWQELKATQHAFPQTGASYHKLLGYYLSNIIHQICQFDNPEDQGVYKFTISYLEALIEYIVFIETYPHPNMHLELLSLKGPALSSLLLAKAKLHYSFNLKEKYLFYYSN